MKYLSLIAILLLLQVSWWFSQRDKALTQAEKNRLLTVIKEYMTQAVKAKEPEAAGIEFSNLYTETIQADRLLKAHFKFSYLQNSPAGETNKVHRKGHFLVTSNDGQQWKAQIDEISDVQVEFIQPLAIEGDRSALPNDTPAAAEDHQEKEHDSADPQPESEPTQIQ